MSEPLHVLFLLLAVGCAVAALVASDLLVLHRRTFQMKLVPLLFVATHFYFAAILHRQE